MNIKSISIKRKYPGKTDTDIYEAALKCFPNMNFEVWKKRELNKMVVGKGNYNGEIVYCDVLSGFLGESATLSIRSETLEESDLQKVAETLERELNKLLV